MRSLFIVLLFSIIASHLFANGEEVTITREGATLSGTLLLPEPKYNGLVFVIIAGSGPTDRDGNTNLIAGDNNSLKYLAEDLRDAGYASLRYDKPGLFKSAKGYNPEFLRFQDMVDGAVWWIEHLRELGFKKIVLLGHSEGALVAKIAAKGRVEGVISLAGAGRNAVDILKFQLQNLDADTRDKAFGKLDSLQAKFRVSDDIQALQSIFYSSVQDYLIDWFQYDPCTLLQNMEIPILIIQGTEDVQVPVADGHRLRDCAVQGAMQYLELRYMNHVLKVIEPGDSQGNQASYGDPHLPLHPGLVHGIVKFVKQRL
jgi:uncharacterized protein